MTRAALFLALVASGPTLAHAAPRAKQGAAVVEVARVAAEPRLTGLLAALEPGMRARVAEMPMTALVDLMKGAADDATLDPAKTEIADAVLAVATLEEVALWSPDTAQMLASLPPGDREVVGKARVAAIAALGDRDPSSWTDDERRVAELLTRVTSTAAYAELARRGGDVALPGPKATLHLGEDHEFLDADTAERVLVEHWGNPPSQSKPLGMIVPVGVNPLAPGGWGVVVTYVEDGHIDDDDAEDIDYDELLEQMKAAEKGDNAERRRLGLDLLELVGWAEPPRYDATAHRLYWACELATPGDAGPHTLNYDVRVLGRKGVLSLNAVGNTDQMEGIREAMEHLLGAVEYETGGRYEDFDPDLDQVAAYGIAGLVAGKIAAKAGLWALLVKLLVAGKKLVLVLIAGIGVALGRIVRRNR